MNLRLAVVTREASSVGVSNRTRVSRHVLNRRRQPTWGGGGRHRRDWCKGYLPVVKEPFFDVKNVERSVDVCNH